MFRCQICGHVVGAKKRANKLVVMSRAKTYASRGANRDTGFRRRFVPGPKKDYDKGGQGSEIVQELTACDKCAEIHASNVTELPEAPAPIELESVTADVENNDQDTTEEE